MDINKITTELMTPDFIDPVFPQPTDVYRANIDGRRYYYTLNENGVPQFYYSMTSVTKSTLPTPDAIIDYIAKHGRSEAYRMLDESSHYGTFLHAECANAMLAMKYNFIDIEDRLYKYLEDNGMSQIYIDWARGTNESGRNPDRRSIERDVAAFIQFLRDYEVKPLASEIILIHPDGYAGAIDIVAEITLSISGYHGEVYKSGKNKGEPKETKKDERHRVIIDVKSGRKGFWETHEIQLGGYRNMWNYTFPDFPVEKIFNWAPSDYRKNPGYKFKDQTDSSSILKLPYMLDLMKIDYPNIGNKKMYKFVDECKVDSEDPILSETTVSDRLSVEFHSFVS